MKKNEQMAKKMADKLSAVFFIVFFALMLYDTTCLMQYKGEALKICFF